MDNLILLALISISAVTVFTALVYGLVMDIHTRTFPKWIWKYVLLPASVCTILWYIILYYQQGFAAVLPTFLTSVIFCTFCWVMAYKMGSGGDWRALFYISLLTPWFADTTLFLSCLYGILQVCIDKFRGSKLGSAWMVSITLAFITSVGTYLYILT
jgi:hypothetical protein